MARTGENEGFDQQRASAREEAETGLDPAAEVTPAQRLTIIRECLRVLADSDLLYRDNDDYLLLLERAAGHLGIPFLEAYFMTEAGIQHPDVDREHLAEWLDWCRVNAPERLATKGGAS